MYTGRTVFRATPLTLLWTLAIPIGLAVIGYFAFQMPEDRWVGWFFAILAPLSVFGFIEALTDYVRLEPDQLRYRRMFMTRVIPKSDIIKATWTSGGGASIQTADGAWRMIPDLGHDAQGVANSLRAWLKAETV